MPSKKPDSIDMKCIGKNIKSARQQKGVSREELSTQVNCSVGHLANIESGTSGASIDLLINLSNTLQVSINDLLYDLLDNKKYFYDSRVYNLLSDCSDQEIVFFIALIKAAKEYLRSSNKTSDDKKNK